jgi:F-type H+-transporting ATPase subunit gamma
MLSSALVDKQISSFRDINNIVEAMKAYAGSALRKAEATVRNVRQCEIGLDDALEALVNHHPSLAADFIGSGRRILVAFGSSVGLCGAFNDKMAEHLALLLQEDDALLVTGKKLHAVAQSKEIAQLEFFESPASLAGIKQALQDSLDCLRRFYAREEYFSLMFVFTVVTDNQVEIVAEQVLPPDLKKTALRDKIARPLLLYEDPATVFSGILDEILATTLYRCYVESLHSENWYRFRAMEAASESLKQRIQELGSLQNYLRQEEVTEEMLEILGGGFFYR